jgi:hypothetical protein
MPVSESVYEPPVLVEVGDFADLTHGGPGDIIEDAISLYI